MSKLRYGVFFVLAAIELVNLSCKKTQQTANNAVLTQAANTRINITVLLSSHPNLLSTGGTDTISNVGIRGLLIYRAALSGDDQFYVYERACTYDGLSNSKAMVFGANQTFTCKDNICSSVFSMSDGSGQPSHGPATYALKQYKYNFDGTNSLIITN